MYISKWKADRISKRDDLICKCLAVFGLVYFIIISLIKIYG